jgi:uncharacterized protein
MKTPRWWSPELALVLGIPLLTIAGGIWTLLLAGGELSSDGDQAGVRRTAQVQTAELAPDLAAARAGLSAQLRVDREHGEVHVWLPRNVTARAAIELDFLHGLDAGRDLQARLQPRDGAWVARLAPEADSRWRVVLADRGRGWRLVGTLPRGEVTLSLQPALAPP